MSNIELNRRINCGNLAEIAEREQLFGYICSQKIYG